MCPQSHFYFSPLALSSNPLGCVSRPVCPWDQEQFDKTHDLCLSLATHNVMIFTLTFLFQLKIWFTSSWKQTLMREWPSLSSWTTPGSMWVDLCVLVYFPYCVLSASAAICSYLHLYWCVFALHSSRWWSPPLLCTPPGSSPKTESCGTTWRWEAE